MCCVQAAQRLGPLLEFLRRHMGLGVQLIMHPTPELSDLPLKSYYRYALPEFAGDGALSSCCLAAWRLTSFELSPHNAQLCRQLRVLTLAV